MKESPAELFRTLIERMTLHIVQIRKFYLLAYPGVPVGTGGRGPGTVRKGITTDAAKMAELEDVRKQKLFEDRFRAGEQCVVAEHKGKIVGYEWYSSGPVHVEQRYFYTVTIPEDAIYAYDAFIRPEYRMSGIWIRFKKHLGEQMLKLKRSRIITLIDCDNTLSLNTHTRFGYGLSKSVVLLKVAGKRYFSEKDMG